MFAPLSASRATTSDWPLLTATIRGVLPYYQRNFTIKSINTSNAQVGRVKYHTIRFRGWDTVRKGRCYIDTFMFVCVLILVQKVCLTYIVLGFDVCPSIQEELQGREMASPSSPVEGGQPTLMKTKTQSTLYKIINEPGKYKHPYRIIIITNW